MQINEMFSLNGKSAVVFGGKGKVGLPMVSALCAYGAEVVIASPSANATDPEVKTLLSMGYKVTAIAVDHANASQMKGMLRTLSQRGQFPEIMINSAVTRPDEVAGRKDTAENWLRSMSENSLGTFLATKLFADAMAENGGGSIINVSSIYGLVASDPAIYAGTEMATEADYPYNKAGMIGFSKHMASLYGRSKVRINCIAPGGLFNNQDPNFVQRYTAKVPLARMAEGSDLHGITVFLASEASKYITGSVIPVDGGLSIR